MKSLKSNRIMLAALGPLAYLIFSAFACGPTTYTKVAHFVDDVSIGNAGFQSFCQNSKATGLITAQEDLQCEELAIKIAAIDQQLVKADAEANAGQSWQTDADAALQLANSLNASGLIFKNPTSQAEAAAIIQGIITAFDEIAAALKQPAVTALPPPAPVAAQLKRKN